MTIDEMLPQVKQVELEILCVIDEFCKKNNIRYSLAYGTLLGAVRHKGFIPWDDDIDLWMPREDYDRFIKLWLANPVDGYIIQNPDLAPDFPQNFTKIRKDNTTFLQDEEEKNKNYHKGIFVDIFPLDRVAEGAVKRNKQVLYAILMMLFTRKFSPPDEKGIKKVISNIVLGMVPKKYYDHMRRIFEKKLLKLSKNPNSKMVCFGTFGSTFRYFPCDMMNELVDIEFENRQFCTVKKWDEFLKIQYGDYMKFPPEEERSWKHHPLIIDLNNNYESNSVTSRRNASILK